MPTDVAEFKHLNTGPYYVDAECPRCGAIETVLVAIKSVLTATQGDLSSLRVKLYGKAREHACAEAVRVLRVDATTGEVTDS